MSNQLRLRRSNSWLFGDRTTVFGGGEVFWPGAVQAANPRLMHTPQPVARRNIAVLDHDPTYMVGDGHNFDFGPMYGRMGPGPINREVSRLIHPQNQNLALTPLVTTALLG